jgi:hypothetical protein
MAIRTDRGKEYEGEFQQFLRREGIVHQRSAPYTPEQNVVAERYNRTLVERMRALLNEFQLPTFLWGEAAKTAAYLRNLMPKSGQKLSPYELMFGVKPSADHLRVFGCTVHAHVPKRHHMHKTDPVGRLGMFVGYAENSKAYRVLVWHKGYLDVIDSARCTFAEHTSPTIDSTARRAMEHAITTEDADLDEDDFWFEDLVVLPHANASIPEDDAIEPQFEVIVPEEHANDQAGTPADSGNGANEASTIIDQEQGTSDGGDHIDATNNETMGGKHPARVRRAPERLVFKVQGVHG